MRAPLVIVGAGGHGREIADIVEAVNSVQGRYDLLGFLDDAPSAVTLARLAARGLKHLGSVEEFLADSAQTSYVLGIGSPAPRAALAPRFEQAGLEPLTLVHPSATIGSASVVGAGSVLFAGARVTTNVEIGRHVHLNQNATVGHDCHLGNFVSVNPLASVSGECTLGDRVMVGTGAAVLQRLTIGDDATVGANACVVRDVVATSVVKGVPAK